MANDERWRRSPPVGRSDPAAELDTEIAFHLEELIRQLREEGWTEADARAEALRRFGTVGTIRRETGAIDRRRSRVAAAWEAIAGVAADFRFAFRVLRRSPGFTILAALSIGLGVGITGAMLSAAYSILIRPLPYPNADQLVSVYARVERRQISRTNISYADFIDWRDENRTLARLGLWTWGSVSFLDGSGGAERLPAAAITAEVLPTIGVPPLLGRIFGPEDGVIGAAPVIILSHDLWVRRFGADSSLVGRKVMVNALPTLVVGVMPRGFAFPDREVAWVPMIPDPAEEHGNRWRAGAIGRLRPGVAVAAASADLDRVGEELERRFPTENLEWRPDVVPLRDDLVGSLRRPLEIFVAAVACLLLIVTANVANLLLVRGLGRHREMAVRAAIGAGRRRLLRQLLVESVALSTLGGTIGLGFAALGIRLLAATFPDGVPGYLSLRLDPTAIAITLGVTLLTGVVTGLVPALRGAAVELTTAIRDGGGSRRSGRLRAGLVVVEIALATILLVSGGLLMKSFSALAGTDLGFDRDRILTTRIQLPEVSYPEPGRQAAFFGALLDRLEQTPGIKAVGAAQGAPMSGWDVQASMTIEGRPPHRPEDPLDVHFQSVTPKYFETLGVRLIRGRWLTDGDRDTANPVALINDVLVEEEFGGVDPIGARIRFGQAHVAVEKPRWITVVGVVESFRHRRLPQPKQAALYFPFATFPHRQLDLLVRTEADDPTTIVPEVRAAVRAIDPAIPIFDVASFEQTLTRVLWQQRLQGQVFGVFASLALLVATVGIYGVISYGVTQRTRELGVRAAVGASTRHLTRLVLRDGVRLALLGIGIGLAGALVLTRFLASLLHGVAPTDPVIFTTAALTLGAVTVAATWAPSRRAARADPLEAIRAE